MSDQLRLAKHIAAFSIDELAEIMQRMHVGERNFDDLLDFAGFLLLRKNLIGALEGLHRSVLADLAQGNSSDTIMTNLLGDAQGPFECVVELAAKMAAKANLSPAHEESFSDAATAHSDHQTPPALIAQAIGQSVTAMRELVLSADRHWLRVMRQGLRKPDAVQFSEYVHFTPDQIQSLFGLAVNMGFLADEDERWVPTELGQMWVQNSELEAWVLMLERLERPLRQLDGISAGAPISAFLAQQYPLLKPESNQIQRFGDLIALTNQGRATELLVRVIAGDLAQVRVALAKVWSKPAERIVLQADQSITVAGPLDPALHIELSQFAEPVDIGLASRFRLGKQSICRGLELGLTATSIKARLEELSGQSVPQPVQYLLDDAERSLFAITVQASPVGTLVSFTDRIESVRLERDRALSPIHLFRTSENQLASRLKPDLVWMAIREAGHIAVRVDAQNQTLPAPSAQQTERLGQSQNRSYTELAAKLLSADAPELDDQNLAKQLQFAMKNKLPVAMSVRMSNGELLSFSAVITGVAETRVRVRDTAADTERTLPLTSIVNWALG